MIPILQFDPSSMSIWYDAHLLHRMKGSSEIGEVMDLAFHDNPVLLDRVPLIKDDWVRMRASTIATAVWHEKRHFLDFTLTNYGAFRVRQFFMIYMALPGILSEARKNGELLVPLQSYLETIVCKTLGVKPPTDVIVAVANNIRQRKHMLIDDRRPVQSRFGSQEIGGEALLEALAHHFEGVKSQILLGPKLHDLVQSDIPDEGLVAARYKWLYEILHTSGLIDVERQGERGQLFIHAGALTSICYAALACRLWGQEQVATEGVSSYLPGYRLASLVTALIPYKRDLLRMSAVQCWNIVNEVCGKIFGRTAVEEMRADIDCESKLIERYVAEQGESLPLAAYRDYHQLRERLFKELVDHPENILGEAEYTLSLGPTLQPFIVVAASSGEIGHPPSDYDRLLGYVEPGTDQSDSSSRWWWAALSKDWPKTADAKSISFRERHAWIEIIETLGPITKLIMDGRNVRTMLGPELVSAEMRLRAQFGIQVRVDPRFAYPKNIIDTSNWYYLTGADRLRCELTFSTIEKPAGVVVDPWMLRLYPVLMQTILGRIADRQNMSRTFQRDWSPWVLSEEFRELFQDTTQDPSLFVGTSWN